MCFISYNGPFDQILNMELVLGNSEVLAGLSGPTSALWVTDRQPESLFWLHNWRPAVVCGLRFHSQWRLENGSTHVEILVCTYAITKVAKRSLSWNDAQHSAHNDCSFVECPDRKEPSSRLQPRPTKKLTVIPICMFQHLLAGSRASRVFALSTRSVNLTGPILRLWCHEF